MSTVSPRILDGGLAVIAAEANRICFCSAEPATYLAAVETLLLGYRQSPAFGALADAGEGRSITMAAFANGSIVKTGTWSHVALVATVNARLLVTHPLSATVAVTAGNSASLPAWTITLPGA